MEVDKSKMMGKKNTKVNKKGWIRIAEAFTAILLLMGAAIIVIGIGVQREDTSKEVYDIEMFILKDIQLNNTLRSEILTTSGTIEWEELPPSPPFPAETKNKIIAKTPEGIECFAKICPPEDVCLWGEESEKNVYAQSILITSTLTNFNPRQLKLFCWEK